MYLCIHTYTYASTHPQYIEGKYVYVCKHSITIYGPSAAFAE